MDDQNETIRRFLRLAAVALGLGALAPDDASSIAEETIEGRRDVAQAATWRQVAHPQRELRSRVGAGDGMARRVRAPVDRNGDDTDAA